jgi:hypothetical protein
VVAVFLLLLAACSPDDQDIPETGDYPSLSTSPATEQDLPIAINQARAELFEHLEKPVGQISVGSVVEEICPTDCMALPASEEICAEMPAQGWIVIVRVCKPESFEHCLFHTNRAGKDNRWQIPIQEDLP